MTPRFFGQWLVQHGFITPNQLLAALDLQLETNKELGAFAVDWNILTKKQAADINRLQRDTDRRFGEIAVEQGLLTEDQVERLLERQRGVRRYLGEILVEEGFMQYHETMSELELFLSEQAKIDQRNSFNIQALAAETSDTDAYLSACLTMFARVAHQELKLLTMEDGAFPRQEFTVMQVINPETNSYLALSLSKSEILHVASAMAGGEFETADPMVLEAAKEMVNVIIGNVAGWLTTEGIEFSPQPPQVVEHLSELPDAENDVTYFFTSPENPLELIVGY